MAEIVGLTKLNDGAGLLNIIEFAFNDCLAYQQVLSSQPIDRSLFLAEHFTVGSSIEIIVPSERSCFGVEMLIVLEDSSMNISILAPSVDMLTKQRPRSIRVHGFQSRSINSQYITCKVHHPFIAQSY